MRLSPAQARWAVASIAGLCALLSLGYALGLRFAPDESSHIQMVSHYSTSLRLATWEDWRWGDSRGHNYHLYSPLPYVGHIPFYWIERHTNGGEELKSGRRVGLRSAAVVYTVLQTWVTWLIAARLFGRTLEAALATLAMNLVPELRYVHGYVNADSFTILCCSTAFYYILRLFDMRPVGLSAAAWIGLTLAALALSKYNGFPVGGFLFAALVVRIAVDRPGWRAAYRKLGIAVSLPLLLAGWFHLHVFQELATGEVMAAASIKELKESTYEGVLPPPRPAWGEVLRHRAAGLQGVWVTFWGWMFLHGSLPTWHIRLLEALALVSCVGFFAILRRPPPMGIERRHLVFLGLGPASMVLTYLLIAMQWPATLQGRYLLTGAPLCVLFFVVGLARVARSGRWISPERALAASAGLWAAVLLLGNALLLAELAWEG